MSNISNRWDLSPERILPDHVLNELSIRHIKFNPIANTFMKKALQRIISKIGVIIAPKHVDKLADSTGGKLLCYYIR